MEHGERRYLASNLARINEPRAPGAHNPALDAQYRARRGPAKANQVFRIGKLDLSLNEGQTYLGLLGRRGSVARRPPWNDIRDVDLLSIESDCVQHAIQQLPRSSDEWTPDAIFLLPRGLADEHDPGARDAVRERKLRGGPLERAAIEFRQDGSQRFQIGRGLRQRASRSLRGVGRLRRAGVLRRVRS